MTEKYTPENSTKEVLLDQEDVIWSTIRHMHIADAMDYLRDQVSKLNDSTTGKYEAGKTSSSIQVDTLKEVVGSLPHYQIMKAKLSIHFELAEKISQLYNKHGLEQVVDFEQDLSTRETGAGKPIGRVKSNEIGNLFPKLL